MDEKQGEVPEGNIGHPDISKQQKHLGVEREDCFEASPPNEHPDWSPGLQPGQVGWRGGDFISSPEGGGRQIRANTERPTRVAVETHGRTNVESNLRLHGLENLQEE